MSHYLRLRRLRLQALARIRRLRLQALARMRGQIPYHRFRIRRLWLRRIRHARALARMLGISRRGNSFSFGRLGIGRLNICRLGRCRYPLLALARMKRISRRKNSISFARLGTDRISRCRCTLQALEPARIPAKTLEAGRRAIKRYVRNLAIWILPGTTLRLGDCAHVYGIKPGDILYEVSGLYNNSFSGTVARRALTRAASRMPTIKTQIIYLKKNQIIIYTK